MQTTIKDIASRLKLSPSTVSRALRDHPDIKPETKEKVKALAKELDYHPNSVARSLQKSKSFIIGVIVPQVKHVFFASIMNGVTDIAYKAGYTVIICPSNESYTREVINTKTLLSHRVAGFLISISKETKNYDHFEMIQRRGIPLVFFDRVCEDIEVCKVVVDDYEGAVQAVDHLISRGYRKIAHLGGPQNLSIGRNRYDGFKDALEKRNIPLSEKYVIYCGLNEEDGMSGFDDLLKQSDELPDAVFAVTDPVAIGAFRRMKEMNLRIPDDIGLVGFSDNPIASLIDPPLTTVKQPAYEIGKTATELLLKEIENGHPSAVLERKVLKTELIVRKST